IDTNGDGTPDPLVLGTPTAITDIGGNPIGTITVNPNGDVTFDPAPNYTGPVPILTYTPNDSTVDGTPATVAFTITPVNDAPVAQNDTFTTFENSTTGVRLLANDTDTEGTPLTVTHVDGVAIVPLGSVAVVNGQVEMRADGTIWFVPAAGYSGPVSFTYDVADSDGANSTGTVTGTVLPADYRPDITLDGTTLGTNVTLFQWNHGDPSDLPMDTHDAHNVNSTYVSATGTETANGNLSLTMSGTTQWIDGVTSATLSDAITNGDYISYSFTVADPLPPGQALQLTGFHIYDTGIVNSYDRTIVIADDPSFANARASVPLNSGGTGNASVDINAQVPIELVPGQTYYIRVYVYGAADPNASAGFDDFTPTFAITQTNDHGTLNAGDPPVAVDPAIANGVHDWAEGDITTLTIVTANIHDGNSEIVQVDGHDYLLGTTDTHTAVAGGTLFDVAYDATTGAFTITNNAGGAMPAGDLQALISSITYRDNQAAPLPGTRTLTFTVTDSLGQASSAAVSSITVGNPTVAVDDTANGLEDTSTTIDVLSTDSNADGLALSVTEVNGTSIQAGGSISVANGVVTLNADGTLTFTPVADFNGPATFAYTVSDVNGASAIANVTINVAPVADIADDTASTPEEGVVTIDVLGNDTFEAPLTVAPPQAIDTDSAFLPPFGFADARAYISGGDTAFPVTIASPGGYPGGIGYAVTSSETGLIQTIRFTVSSDAVGSGIGGIVTDASGNPLAGHWQMLPTGSAAFGDLRYLPMDATSVNSPVTFEYVLDTPTPANTVYLNLAADGFVAANYQVLSASFTDTRTPLQIVSIDGMPASGGPVTVANGTATLNPDGTIDFNPDVNFAGTTSFTYTVLSGGVMEIATVTVTVTPVNDAPVAQDDAFVTPEDTAHPGTLPVATDVDGGTLTYALGGTSPSHGTVTVNADGTYLYTPAADYHGPDSFTYTVTDGTATVEKTVTVTVTPVNDAPVAQDDAFVTPEDTAHPGTLPVATDVDGGTLTYALGGTSPSHGTVTVNADGTYLYTPSANYHGPDSFTYTVTDGTATVEKTVTVTVTPVNDAPVALDDSFVTSQNSPISFDPRGNDSDPDGDALRITAINGMPIHPGQLVVITGGAISIDSNGRLTFIPSEDFVGPSAFAYTLEDGLGGTAAAQVKIVVIEGGSSAPVVPVLPEEPIELPVRPNQPAASLAVQGAVLDAVNEVASLGSMSGGIRVTGIVIDTVNLVSPLGDLNNGVATVADVAAPLDLPRLKDLWHSTSIRAVNAAMGEPERLAGFSLRLGFTGFGMEGSSRSHLIIETLVRDRTLAVQLSSTASIDKRIVDYRVMRADGGPMPGWLDRIGLDLLIGQRPADVDRIALRIIIIFGDGTTELKDVEIDTMSGEIKTLGPGKRADVRLPFMDQPAAGSMISDHSFPR
ncbi:MAG TPA: Ig-like domain-containing protein, partial [Hyphomicrobiaceae bacterium]|nr:Ig-like domain-containing protein [Hyphomicrobiaceae bacterium]